MLASTNRAVFRYAGSAWAPSSEGINRSWTRVLASGTDGTVYAGAFEGDVSRYDVAAGAWTPLPYLRFPEALAPAPNGRLFAGTLGAPGAWVLDAAGEAWAPLGLRSVRSLHRTAAGTLLAAILDAITPHTLARSTDDGASWSTAAPFAPLAFLEVGGTLYAGTEGGVHRSTDDGLTWEPRGLEGERVTGLAAQDGSIWAVSRSYGQDGPANALYRSTDGGQTWDVRPAPPSFLGEHVVATGDAVYTTGAGLYRSTDDGETWAPFQAGFPDDGSIEALTLGPDGRLYAGLFFRSVYRTTEPVATSSAPPPTAHGLALRAPYPNPASRRAVMPIEVGAPSIVRLCVYDVLGREVAVLHDGPLAAGEHAFAFDGRGLPSGVYVVRATSGGLSLTQRVTLLR